MPWGFSGALPAAGRLATWTLSAAVALPLIGRKPGFGVKVQVTPAGAEQLRKNCPAKFPVLTTVTAKFADPPNGIAVTEGAIDPPAAPTVTCIFRNWLIVGVEAFTVKGKLPKVNVLGTETATVTVVPEIPGVTDAGLNEHCAPGGRLPQAKLTDWLNALAAVKVN